MKDEDKTFENEVTHLFDYKKQLYAMQKYKSEAIMLENQLKGTKRIVIEMSGTIRELKNQNDNLQAEIARLNEDIQLLEMQIKK